MFFRKKNTLLSKIEAIIMGPHFFSRCLEEKTITFFLEKWTYFGKFNYLLSEKYFFVKNKLIARPFFYCLARSFIHLNKKILNFLSNLIRKNEIFNIVKPYRRFKRFIKRIIIRRILRSKLTRDFLFGNSFIAKSFFKHLKIIAWETNNFTLLVNVARIYQLRKQYREAFDVYFYLFKKTHKIRYCARAIVCEVNFEEKPLYQYYLLNKNNLPQNIFYYLTCEYAQYFDGLIVEWDQIKELILKDFFPPLLNKSLLAALATNNTEYISWVESIILDRLTLQNKEELRRTLTMIAACYYRTGRSLELINLGKKVKYENYDWKLYLSFGAGDIMSAMNYRSKAIKNSFFLYYNENKFFYDKVVLIPEKDLCGEAFNSLFYSSIFEDIGSYYVVCDERLYKIMCSNFENINFIQKKPRYLVKTNREFFSMLPFNLDNYLDNYSYKETLGSKFITIDYRKYFFDLKCQIGRENGWLRADRELVLYWENIVKSKHGSYLIGFSSNSTVRSKIRDMHMVNIDYWDRIFKLPNCSFVNLNASFSSSDCEKLSDRYGIKIYNPDFDLYNDFDNLLALMSVLDYGILPANNLMDFAAAIGLKSIVFSPSNIMKVWAVDRDNKYVFSNNVKFIFPKQVDDNYKLVEEGVQIIRRDLNI